MTDPNTNLVEAMPDRCDQCRLFWRTEDAADGDNGICRRYPPQALVDPSDGGVFTLYPHVQPAAWCGEFSPKTH